MKKFIFLLLVFVAILSVNSLAQDERGNPWTRNTSFAFNVGNISGAMIVPLFEAQFDFTIDSVKAVNTGTTPETEFNMYYGSSVASGTDIFASDQTVTSETTGDLFTTFSANTVSLGEYIVVEIISVVGTVDNFTVTVYITKTS